MMILRSLSPLVYVLMSITLFLHMAIAIDRTFKYVHRPDDSCPRFLLISTDNQGFGDQLEHYIFYLHLAYLVGATVVLDDTAFTSVAKHHKGYQDYKNAAIFLGVNFNMNYSVLMTKYPILIKRQISYSDALRFNISTSDCHLLMTSSLYRFVHITIEYRQDLNSYFNYNYQLSQCYSTWKLV